MASSSFDLPGLTYDIDITIGQHSLEPTRHAWVCRNPMGGSTGRDSCQWEDKWTLSKSQAIEAHRKHTAEEIVKLLAQWGDMETERRS